LENKYKNIYIAGAGNIGKSLAKKTSEDFNVKLIEKSEEQSELANEALNNVLVLNADAADKDFLDSESIQDCDVFVAVTHDDESNVLCSLMAKKLGSKKTVTIINNEAYFDLVGKNELDIIISPVQITVSHILKYIRKGTVSNVHKVKKGKAEAIELLIDDGVKNIAGKTVEDLKLNENINIPCIKRDEGILMAHGTTEILDNDHLIVFYKNKDDIEDFYNRYK